jgi:UDP-N-acetylmuramoyl-L-alanyl-D-glutamate--2,6-diaminopimelate ligase
MEIAGVDVHCAAIEVSSHSIAEHRISELEFAVGVFTNLSQDHLDYHGSFEEYASTKKRFFDDYVLKRAGSKSIALNADDHFGMLWSQEFEPNAITFGLANGQLRGRVEDMRVDRLSLAIEFEGQNAGLELPMGGEFNGENCLAATAAMLLLGYELSEICSGFSAVPPVPGRFEPVQNALGIGCIVDYAHTPDGLEKLFDSARKCCEGRLIGVFGCGGDRDRTKRPLMARAVSSRADLTVLTSDNPRTEDPQSIIDDAKQGLVPGAESIVCIDRAEAVVLAVARAGPGDVVVVAGKGHENYQIIGTTKHPMDDRELIRAGFEALVR